MQLVNTTTTTTTRSNNNHRLWLRFSAFYADADLNAANARVENICMPQRKMATNHRKPTGKAEVKVFELSDCLNRGRAMASI